MHEETKVSLAPLVLLVPLVVKENLEFRDRRESRAWLANQVVMVLSDHRVQPDPLVLLDSRASRDLLDLKACRVPQDKKVGILISLKAS